MELFEQIYTQYQPDVYRFLMRLSGYDTQMAEELTQETFFQAFRSFAAFRGECEMRTWLCQIARNCWCKYVRQESRQRSIAEREAHCIAPPPPVGEAMEKREQLLHIRAAIATLDSRSRAITEYRLYSGLSYAEIARITGLRENTAAAVFNRAKVKIRRILQEVYKYEI